MFGRKKSHDEEITELDAAWENETNFPKPHEFDLSADSVPVDQNEREAQTDVPFDTEESFAYDAEGEEFTEGDAEGFLDDSHTDFYEYGQQEHGVHDTVERVAEDEGLLAEDAAEGTPIAGGVGRHDSGLTTKQVKLDQMPEHQKRSRRMRRVLRVIIVLLLALMAALAYFGFRLYQESRQAVEQETNEVVTEVEVAAEKEEIAPDTGSTSTQKTTVPDLLSLMGKTQEEALAALGKGAAVTLDAQIPEPTSPMMHRVTAVLTEEPTDTKSGAPTVYLGMGPDEKVVIVGYSAATASLGYGTLSFADVVTNQHVVERTLSQAGLAIEEGSVVLPESSQYSTYAEDGKTLVKEQCTFDGTTTQNGITYAWTSVLVYNYTAANATGNLADTVRQVYVYISDKDVAEVAIAEKAAKAKEAEEAAKKAEEAAKKAEAEASSSAEPKAEAEASSSADLKAEASAQPEAASSAA